MAKAGVKLSPPWDTYVHYIESLFKGDPEVHLNYDEPNRLLKILVDEQEKYEAIDKIMPTSVAFGNVTLNIEVVPADEEDNVEIEEADEVEDLEMSEEEDPEEKEESDANPE